LNLAKCSHHSGTKVPEKEHTSSHTDFRSHPDSEIDCEAKFHTPHINVRIFTYSLSSIALVKTAMS